MRIFIIVYLIGFILSGVFTLISFNNKKFMLFHKSFLKQMIKEQTDEDVSEEILDSGINMIVRDQMFLSYIGIVIMIKYWLMYRKYQQIN